MLLKRLTDLFVFIYHWDPKTALFKLGSADPWGSAVAPQGVREKCMKTLKKSKFVHVR